MSHVTIPDLLFEQVEARFQGNSDQAIAFRRWATAVLRELILRGYAVDQRILSKRFLDSDYFDDLIERIEEIRLSKRNFCQRLTDIYAQCSSDYDPESGITQGFYTDVSQKLFLKIRDRAENPIFFEIIGMYLDYAIQQAVVGKAMCMNDWIDRMALLFRFDPADFEKRAEYIISELSHSLESIDHEP